MSNQTRRLKTHWSSSEPTWELPLDKNRFRLDTETSDVVSVMRDALTAIDS